MGIIGNTTSPKETIMVENHRYTVVYIDGVPFYTIKPLRRHKK